MTRYKERSCTSGRFWFRSRSSLIKRQQRHHSQPVLPRRPHVSAGCNLCHFSKPAAYTAGQEQYTRTPVSRHSFVCGHCLPSNFAKHSLLSLSTSTPLSASLTSTTNLSNRKHNLTKQRRRCKQYYDLPVSTEPTELPA